ncbi:MAG: hypothetical protein AAFV85_19385 [Cyanobacteria bacterium J06634_6]
MTLRSTSFVNSLTVNSLPQLGTSRLKERMATVCVGCVGAIALTLALSYSLASAAQAQTAQTETTSIVTPPATPTASNLTPFSPNIAGIVDLSADEGDAMASVGHLRPQDVESLGDDDVNWLSSTILPLYVSPGGEHWGWIYQGWLVLEGQAPIAIGRDAGFAMVKAYENLYTFPVLEARDDGWFRVQYTAGGSAWAHTSQLALGDTPLTLEDWSEHLESQASVFFLDRSETQALRSRPEPANNLLSLVAADSLIEPLDFAGDWMRVRVTRPTAACEPLTGATVTEGWMRWRNEAKESLVWYAPSGSCQQG